MQGTKESLESNIDPDIKECLEFIMYAKFARVITRELLDESIDYLMILISRLDGCLKRGEE